MIRRKIKIIATCMFVFGLTAISVMAGSALDVLMKKRIAYCPGIHSAPVIDGKLDDTAWGNAWKTGSFTFCSSSWKPATQNTVMYLCRDDKHIYIAAKCYELRKDKLTTAFHPSFWHNENIEVMLQPSGKIKSQKWNHIAVNIKGDIWFADETVIPEMPGRYKIKQLKNHQIKVKTATDTTFWTVEMKVPFDSLGTDSASEKQDWRANFCRSSWKPNIFLAWNKTNSFQNPKHFGILTFLNKQAAQKSEKLYNVALNDLKKEKEKMVKSLTKSNYKLKYAFNFAPDGQCKKTGYKHIDSKCIYSSEQGYGWLNTTGISCQTLNDISGSSKRLKSWQTGPLSSSWAYATAPAGNGKVSHTFRVDLPDGDYKVHLLAGLMAPERMPHRRQFDVFCNGTKINEYNIGHYTFARDFFKTKVTQGKLLLTLTGPAEVFPRKQTEHIEPGGMKKYHVPGWLINSLVIYPLKDRKMAEQTIQKDQVSLLFCPVEELIQLKKIKHQPLHGRTTFTKAEEEQGVVVFKRPLGEIIYPSSRPGDNTACRSLDVRAAAGETIYMSFGLLPLRDLNDVTITISDLKGSKSGTIHSKDIRIRTAVFCPWKYYGTSDYGIEPLFLDDYSFTDSDMNKGQCKWIWLSCKTSETFESGIYGGEMTISSHTGIAAKVNVSVNILPFKLENPVFRYGGFHPGGCGFPSYTYEDVLLNSAADVGMNAFYISLKTNPGEHDLMILKKRLLNMKTRGITGPLICGVGITNSINHKLRNGVISELPQSEIDAHVAIAKTFQDWKKEGLPELIYFTMDEAHCKGENYWKERIRIYDAVKKSVPGIRTAATESDRSYWRVKDSLDVPVLFEVDDFNKWRFSAEDAVRGREVWSYPNQAMMGSANINAGRFCTGWLPALTGLKGVVPWVVFQVMNYPESRLRIQPWTMFIPRAIGGYRITPRLVTVMGHIGTWDLRYYATLKKMIAEAKESGTPKAKTTARQLEAMLNSVSKSTHPGYMYYFLNNKYWPAASFVELRKRVVDGILQLYFEQEGN